MASLQSLTSTPHLGGPPHPSLADVEIVRRCGNFPPPIWNDYFIHLSQQPNVDEWGKRVEELKVQVKRILSSAEGTDIEIDLIDTIQRLGLAYHFEDEIDKALLRIYDVYRGETITDDQLHVVALRFRLLRQHGYNVSSDVLGKFIMTQKELKDSSSTRDVEGLLSLYEAAFVSVRGEDMLDEAIGLTREQLKAAVPHLDPPLAAKVRHALELPLHKRAPRLEARHYISLYQDSPQRNELILELAKLDFNILQSLHRAEISELQRWWKEIGINKKLPFFKDRLVENYMVPLNTHAEPEYGRARIMATKMLALITFIDDIYDTHATFEELLPFTDAFERWDLEGMDKLPEYMKITFLAMYNCVNENADEVTAKGKPYRGNTAKEALRSIVRAYMAEAEWHNRGYIPGVEECLKVTGITGAFSFMITSCFLGAREHGTKEVYDWLLTEPKFLIYGGLQIRIVDDLQSYQFEQKRDHVASVVQCYSKEYCVSEEEACTKIREIVSTIWKDINQVGLASSTPLPQSMFTQAVNMLRAIEVIYLYEDGFTFIDGKMKEYITSLLVDPVPL